MKYLICLLLISCGVEHRVTGVNGSNISIGPNFKKAIEICDKRYGKKTEESEECFKDYRNFTKITLSIDLASIEAFCSSDNVVDSQACVEDLIGILGSLGGSL